MAHQLLPAEVKSALIDVCGRAFWYKQPLFDMFARAGIPEELYLKYEHEPKFKIGASSLLISKRPEKRATFFSGGC